MTILLAGATGLIGTQLTRLLPQDEAHLLTRRAVDGGLDQTVVPPADWPAAIAKLKPVTTISTLGTTIRQAGSQGAFRAVDYDLVLSVATAAKAAGARHFIMVSSVGASAQSRNFYLKIKGEVEDAVRALGFERTDILRPGLLRGDRSDPTRWGEKMAMIVSPVTDLLTPAVLSQYRSIEAASVAGAIAALIGTPEGGAPQVHEVHHNREMLALARAIG